MEFYPYLALSHHCTVALFLLYVLCHSLSPQLFTLQGVTLLGPRQSLKSHAGLGRGLCGGIGIPPYPVGVPSLGEKQIVEQLRIFQSGNHKYLTSLSLGFLTGKVGIGGCEEQMKSFSHSAWRMLTVSSGCCKYEDGLWEEGWVSCPREVADFTEKVMFKGAGSFYFLEEQNRWHLVTFSEVWEAYYKDKGL